MEGLSNKLIARGLRISEHGAKRLVANVLAEMNCPNRTQAARDQLRVGHLDRPERGGGTVQQLSRRRARARPTASARPCRRPSCDVRSR
ncbi:LuxR C-terminal-related transcriptional regulator [Streptomyces sp. NBC_00203]|uniref:LuxR C-terminal-related transcriptional regulator n=1 Tax=Streptomyces sp. NBC_00203 TaxID=2975680 RepID=UPI0032516AF1